MRGAGAQTHKKIAHAQKIPGEVSQTPKKVRMSRKYMEQMRKRTKWCQCAENTWCRFTNAEKRAQLLSR
jgi:hypothetical protein